MADYHDFCDFRRPSQYEAVVSLVFLVPLVPRQLAQLVIVTTPLKVSKASLF